ncbi:hypothetical protein H4R18_003363 [Coemansia javaensis]|uniref:Uncharacterized protein n=1 Tax=Coemansia javaensis TaxID=2761396 RepID=A0A9W8HCB2_9FUNG|nr:hypothetical protein H4R18_003363 [Coemansia javaensis]
MKLFAAIVLLASAVAAQEIGAEGGDLVAAGPAAVNDENVNKGTQTSNSLIDASTSGNNKLSGLTGNSFQESKSNSASSDNNIINPTSNGVSGNRGNTANGANNRLTGNRRRDVIINHNSNNRDSSNHNSHNRIIEGDRFRGHHPHGAHHRRDAPDYRGGAHEGHPRTEQSVGRGGVEQSVHSGRANVEQSIHDGAIVQHVVRRRSVPGASYF